METLARQWCSHHPDRPALALCMSCRKSICQECATQWEGIHFCAECLPQQRKKSARSRPLGFIWMILFSIALCFAIVRLAVGIGAYLADVL